MRQTTKQKVMDTILTAPKVRVGRRNMYVLSHQTILNLSKSEDSATRRLREMAQTYGNHAYVHKDNQIVIEPSFVDWLRKIR